MEYAVVCITALVAAGLTLFSGFGLGTLLMPAFAVFFPLEVAVSAAAVVHLANNLFKLGLVGRRADWGVVARFAVPAAAAALLGALALAWLSRRPPILGYSLGGLPARITLVKLAIAAVMAAFAVAELTPRFQRLSFDRRLIPLGGIISGFFGGLSGHQGALRSAFLIRAGLSKEAFIGTGVVAAVAVDVVRLSVYGGTVLLNDAAALHEGDGWRLVIAASIAAFIGSAIGARLVRAVEMKAVRAVVGGMLLLMAAALACGLI